MKRDIFVPILDMYLEILALKKNTYKKDRDFVTTCLFVYGGGGGVGQVDGKDRWWKGANIIEHLLCVRH